MTRLRPTATAVLIAAVLLASGCSRGGTSTSRPESGTTAPTTTRATATTPGPSTPTTQSATDAGADELAARFPRTAAGAEAFVGYLFGILRRANATPDPWLVAPLVDQASCSDCKHWVDSLASMRTAGEHFVGDFVVPQNVITRQITGSTAVVVATVVTPAGQRVDSHGTVVHTRTSTGPFRYDLRLEFRKHWVVVYAESVL
jgi:hypothetical protein